MCARREEESFVRMRAVDCPTVQIGLYLGDVFLGCLGCSHTMAQEFERVIYLGRNQAAANALRAILCAHFSAIRPGAPTEMNPEKTPEKLLETLNGHGESASRSAPPHFCMELVSSQKNALPAAQRLAPSLILIETSNKSASRLRFCQMLRERMPAAAIVAVAPAAPSFEFAFDGVLRTPIDEADVLRLMNKVWTRLPELQLRRGALLLDLGTRQVTSPQGNYEMTPKECALLRLLMANDGKVVRRADILQQVWETDYLEDTRTLDVHIRWLRRKVESDPSEPRYILTRRGVGYLFKSGD